MILFFSIYFGKDQSEPITLEEGLAVSTQCQFFFGGNVFFCRRNFSARNFFASPSASQLTTSTTTSNNGTAIFSFFFPHILKMRCFLTLYNFLWNYLLLHCTFFRKFSQSQKIVKKNLKKNEPKKYQNLKSAWKFIIIFRHHLIIIILLCNFINVVVFSLNDKFLIVGSRQNSNCQESSKANCWEILPNSPRRFRKQQENLRRNRNYSIKEFEKQNCWIRLSPHEENPKGNC